MMVQSPALAAPVPVRPFPIDIFAPLSPPERAAFVARYLEHLRRHDGVPDLETWTFSVREPLFREIEANPILCAGPPLIDPAVFHQNANEQDVADAGLDERTLWAVFAARANRHEQYAVRYLEETGRYLGGDPNDPATYIDVEERYHARILDDVLRTVGLVPHWRPPRPLSRFMLRQIVRLPKFIANVTVLCGEIIGVTVFALILERAERLLAEQPGPARRVQQLLQQILADEVGHVYYLRSQLGPVRLFLARLLLPIIARVMMADLPEGARLFGWEVLYRRILDRDVARVAPGVAAALGLGR